MLQQSENKDIWGKQGYIFIFARYAAKYLKIIDMPIINGDDELLFHNQLID